ncbi:MAG: hypothetical protein ACOYM9_24205 [Bradymonadia bacterium]
MLLTCNACGARVDVVARHGLSGTLCPECNEVIATGKTPAPEPQKPVARPARAPRIESRAECRACGGPRDRDARRCGSCRESWLYRVGALGFDTPRARGSLVEWIVHRDPRAPKAEKLDARFARLPAIILGGLTENQALRARHELENVGVQVALEEDDAAPPMPSLGGSRVGVWAFFAVPATLLFAGGLWLMWDTEQQVGRRRAAPASTAPSLVPAKTGADAPSDVLGGLVEVRLGARVGVGFVVDRDGWVVAPLAFLDGVGGATMRVAGHDLRATLSRRDDTAGLGLFKVPMVLPYALGLGDLTTVGASDATYVGRLSSGVPELRPATVLRPDARRGDLLVVALERTAALLGDDVLGAPLFNPAGLVVAVRTAPAGLSLDPPTEARVVHAWPVNLLVEGPQALLTEIRAPRASTPKLLEWQARVRADARAEHPELHAALESALLLEGACEVQRCRVRLGVPLRGAMRVDASAPVELTFLTPDQDVDDRNPRFGRELVQIEAAAFKDTPFPDATMLSQLSLGARRSWASGEVDGLRLVVAELTVARPTATRARTFRIGASGLGGRRATGLLIDLEAPPVGDALAASSAPPTPPVGEPRLTAFGPFTGAEWQGRFRNLAGELRKQIEKVRGLEARKSAGESGADALLLLELQQLERLRTRHAELDRDASTFRVPDELRR